MSYPIDDSSQKRPLNTRLYIRILKIGILLYPSYVILDWFVYPEHVYLFLAIRCFVSFCLFLALLFYDRINKKHHSIILIVCFFTVSFGISLMCFYGGEGFHSSYIIGVVQILLVTTLFQEISKKTYLFVVTVIVVPHFLLLSFTPWSLQGLLINLFGILVFSVIAVVAHNFLTDLSMENKALKGILPICARCKKIRDDKGYWNDVAAYVRDHADVEFSHGLCEDCMKDLYPEYVVRKEGKPQ